MEDKKFRSVSFLIISLIVHILFFLFFMHYKGLQWLETETKEKPDPSVTFLDISDVEDRMKGQIVDQDDQKSEQAAKDAKFLGKNNKMVKKETRSANKGDFRNRKSKQEVKLPKQQPSQQASAASAPKPQKKQVEFKTYENGDVMVGQQKVKPAETFDDLRLNNVQQMASVAPVEASRNDDYLKDTEIGAETHLNTREFLYFTYFNRIKTRLRKYWEPMIHEKVRHLLRTGRNPASFGSKVTRLIITLDQKGILTRVQLMTTSGLEDLDDAAIEAFRAAAPFPNPPDDLIKNGYVQINWDFVLET